MRRSIAAALLAAACLLALVPAPLAAQVAPSAAQPGPAEAVAVERHGEPARSLSLADLAALPPREVSVSFLSEHGEQHATYRGVLLWDLLVRAGAVDPAQRREHVRETVAVTGRDGYTAVIAAGEIDPDFEGKQVVLATERDGRPLGVEHLRLAVPGDRHGGRNVRDVVRIAVE